MEQNEALLDTENTCISETNTETQDIKPKKDTFRNRLDAYFKTFFKYNVPGRRARAWEIDFWRGLLIIGVTIFHVTQFLGMQELINYSTEFGMAFRDFMIKMYESNYYQGLRPFGVFFFVALSGISCSMTRSHGKRALKFVIFTVIFQFFLGLLIWFVFHRFNVIFNIIFVLMVCTVVWWIFEATKAPDWVRLIVASVALIIGVAYYHGYYVRENITDEMIHNYFWALFVQNDYILKISQYDFQPLFPHLGIFIFAGVIGKHLYKEKKTLTTREYPPKIFLPVLWCGKHSLLMYLSFPIYVGIVMLLAILI